MIDLLQGLTTLTVAVVLVLLVAILLDDHSRIS